MPIQFTDVKGKQAKDVGKRFDISSEIKAAAIIGIYFPIRLRTASPSPFALFPLLRTSAGVANRFFKSNTRDSRGKNQPVL